MSEKNETLEHAVNKVATAMLNTSMQNIDASTICGWANALGNAVEHFRDTTKMIPEEVAVAKMETTTPTCDKSSHVGDMEAIREALQKVISIYESWASSGKEANDYLMSACHVAVDALSTPPRNCDRFSSNEQAWDAYCEYMSDSNVMFLDYEEWLFDKVKGEKQ